MYFSGNNITNLPGVNGNPIDGVIIKQLKRIPDERGAIYHFLRNDDEIFEKFGEIYFSKINPGIIKGWHIHSEMVLNYMLVYGNIKLVLYDDRDDSPTKGNLLEIFMGSDNFLLVKVPANVWNGFKGIGTESAIVANCSTIPHDPNEIDRKDPFTDDIPYDWSVKHG